MMASIDVRALAVWLNEELDGGPFSIDDQGARAGGMSHLNLTARGVDGRRVVVRVPPERGPLEPYDLDRELFHHRLAHDGGVPVAELLRFVADPHTIGSEFAVFAFVEGDVLVPDRARQDTGPGIDLACELVDALAAIHAVPVGAELLSDRAVSPEAIVASTLERSPVGTSEPPILAYLAAWLLQHCPEQSLPPTLVHGDYRLGNMIWRSGRIVAVLDWETAMLGSPYYDLAWLIMNTASDEDPVMGLTTRGQVLQRYEETTGVTVSREELRWWEVLTGWVRVRAEILGLRLNQEQAVPDLRSLAWEFGHLQAFRHLLERAMATDRDAA